jgi:hypothetical protein
MAMDVMLMADDVFLACDVSYMALLGMASYSREHQKTGDDST